MEALKAKREFDKIIVAKGDRTLQRIIDMAKESNIPIQYVNRYRLDEMATTPSHQGVIALTAAHNYVELDDILHAADEKGEPPFVVILDGICDPHNLGSILRTANAVGAHGVIIPKRRSVGLNATVAKTSAGAIEYTPVARVSNIAQAIDLLKKQGFWVYGTSSNAPTSYEDADFSGAVALVIGSEGEGMSILVGEKCDFLLSIPMAGEIESLNASVAAGVLMYKIFEKRRKR
jgi:23S rRNA (guanosine2251-2'-O)-methyltransferase